MSGPVCFICSNHFYEQQKRSQFSSRALAVHNAREDCSKYFAGCADSFCSMVARNVIKPETVGRVYLLPRDPKAPLSADNIFGCNGKIRRLVIDLWVLRPDRPEVYTQLVDSLVSD